MHTFRSITMLLCQIVVKNIFIYNDSNNDALQQSLLRKDWKWYTKTNKAVKYLINQIDKEL